MSDLSKYTGPVRAEGFRFGERPPAPLDVTVRRRIVKPTPDGPCTTDVVVRRYVDGELVAVTHESPERGEPAPE